MILATFVKKDKEHGTLNDWLRKSRGRTTQ